MIETLYRIGIAGATTLLGHELHEELNQSSLAAADIRLLDHEEAAGKLEATEEEISIVHKIDPDAFDGLDLVFFAGDTEMTAENKGFALSAGASVVDLSIASDDDFEAVVRAPWIQEATGKYNLLGLQARLVVPAHPASLMLALVATRVHQKAPIASLTATVFEPVSQLGKEAMDELHQQTTSLLGFQSLPKDIFGEQIAFNMLAAYGPESPHKLNATEARILRQYQQIGAGQLPSLAVQLIQAPVFHGYTASVLIELENEVSQQDLESLFEGGHIALAQDDSEGPNNISAAARPDVMVRVRPASPRKWWLWLAADNLKLATLNAIACAVELQRLRPVGKVQ